MTPENPHPSGVRMGVSASGALYWNIEVASAAPSLEAMRAALATAAALHEELSQRYPPTDAR